MSNIPNTSGIYKITCTVTSKIYVGSAVTLRHRRDQHFYSLRNNQHNNPKLQNAWNKYGSDAFTFEVLEFVLPMFQVEREQYWLDTLKPFGKKGFNMNPTANKPSFSPETCEKIRLAKLGHTVSEEARTKISIGKMGSKFPEGYHKKTLIVTAPDGTEYIVTGVRKFCEEHSLDTSSLMRTVNGFDRGTAYTQHKGYKARFPETL